MHMDLYIRYPQNGSTLNTYQSTPISNQFPIFASHNRKLTLNLDDNELQF